ncbi:MAG TPA: hypothetical protein VGK99_03200 [Acidobacteriota bacterium]|jgi:Tol biopolymer transport system component
MTKLVQLRWIATLVTALIVVSGCPDMLLAQHRPNGTIAYNRFDPETGRGQLWLLNASSGEDQPVALHLVTGLVALPVWSRDGKVVAITGALPEDADQAASEIFIFDPAGFTLQQVTHLNDSGGSLIPLFKAFSPDRKRLAFVAFNQSSGRAIIGVDRLDRTEEETIIADTVTTSEGFPLFGLDWYPRGNLLVTPGTVDLKSGKTEAMTALFMVRPAGDAVQHGFYWQLTFPDAEPACNCSLHDVLPVFSPTGSQIAFVRWTIQSDGKRSKSSVRILDLFLRQEHEVVAFSQETVASLSWSPDGMKLLFDRGRDIDGIANPGSLGLWTVNIDGTALRYINRPTALSASWNWAR